MAIAGKSMTQLRSNGPAADQAKLDATTPDDGRAHAAEHEPDPDAALTPFALVLPVREVRRKFAMSEAEFAATLHIPIGAIRDWE
jgi:DNA-binding transcriptional regulator YiaG